MTVDVKDDFVVFIIGMRINKLWKINKWLPIVRAMPKMLEELYANPKLGFIHHESWLGRTSIMLQYWKSFDHLEAYAQSRDGNHLPAWADFNRKIGHSGDVGIWHETYRIENANYESIYNNMPRFALGMVGEHIPVKEKLLTARGRLETGK